jgi:hypothetical protein
VQTVVQPRFDSEPVLLNPMFAFVSAAFLTLVFGPG